MADLQSCFFCGTPEQLTQYAVVPPRYTDDGDPQTAVLCPQCKTKLLQVIEPLVDRLEGDGSAAADSQQESTSGDGITMTPPGGAGQSGTGSEDGATTESAVGGDESGAESASPESGESESGSQSVGGGSEAPPNYRRAMRMLETRQFPLDRTEVESLLAGAYDMETHELEAVLGHAVETGKLVEEDGQFRKPE